MNSTHKLQSGEIQTMKGKSGDSLEEMLGREGRWHGEGLC